MIDRMRKQFVRVLPQPVVTGFEVSTELLRGMILLKIGDRNGSMHLLLEVASAQQIGGMIFDAARMVQEGEGG